MNLCETGHDEVCFEGKRCPVCQLIKEKDAAYEKLVGERDDLLDQIHELKEQLREYEADPIVPAIKTASAL